ncbi:hypothetical protein LCGC14_0467050 [marine sediment metagenome]|uniref:Uncharacterized protein n=1 Tax=marine sediment metagenome TaxID=412755 RepID=A0A0F9SDJ7_9ZZZZ
MSHTMGDWQATQDVGGRWHVDSDYKGPESDYIPIADVKQGADDAAVISAAPDLLNVCRQVLRFSNRVTPLEATTLANLNAALAKAERRQG